MVAESVTFKLQNDNNFNKRMLSSKFWLCYKKPNRQSDQTSLSGEIAQMVEWLLRNLRTWVQIQVSDFWI